MQNHFDVIVIGGGHAGVEAALASARLGSKTALCTMKVDHIAYMSCNPAIGGQAKGQLAREVDALGGQMGINTDYSALQYKRLNQSKGPAVRSSRAQCDKVLYSKNMQATLKKQENLTILEYEIIDINFKNAAVESVTTHTNEKIAAKAVIITAGTFLSAVMHCGETQERGGRAGDASANALSKSLLSAGFSLKRLKTGTPARLFRDSINYKNLEIDWGDKKPHAFSFYHRTNPFPYLEQMPCHITYTNKFTHEIIANAQERSPMFTGAITGKGPRYCPSIEDKVFRFASRDRHQIYLEPESASSDWIYANGLSTSLPLDVQEKFLRSIEGLKNVEIARAGYAVEYDAIDPRILTHGMQVKEIKGLFCAGQVNGTSGYEEAAAQGLIAGINASLVCQNRGEFHLERDEAYVAVLIDDLVTKGCEEPYRMFTSRAEYRLSLREDTADLRLGEKSYQLGLLKDEYKSVLDEKINNISKIDDFVQKQSISPKLGLSSDKLKSMGISNLKDKLYLGELLKRPEVNLQNVIDSQIFDFNSVFSDLKIREDLKESLIEEVETSIKYAGYIKHENQRIQKFKKQERKRIPKSFNYQSVTGLSHECREKLEGVRPETLGQAMRISGITPAAGALVAIHLEKSYQANVTS